MTPRGGMASVPDVTGSITAVRAGSNSRIG